MEQHAVPQPITSYEFRLVGDMTIRQFGKLAAGVILALIVYAINPAPGIFKWTLIFIFVLLGVGMAFFPFEGRPIDTWILAFFKRIYSPTQYVWRQGGQYIAQPTSEIQEIAEPTLNMATVQGVDTTNTITPASIPDIPTTNQTSTTVNPPSLGSINLDPVQVKDEENLINSVYRNRVVPPVVELKEEVKPEENIEVDTTTLFKSSPAPTQNEDQKPKQVKPGIVEIGKTTIYSADTPNADTTQMKVNQTVAPTFNTTMVMPSLYQTPNILAGFVKDNLGKLVEGAIIEVRDSTGNPVRAFKTNKLGQFQIATPLSNGIYEVETEKDGLSFDIIKIDLKGEQVPPFEIVARGKTVDG